MISVLNQDLTHLYLEATYRLFHLNNAQCNGGEVCLQGVPSNMHSNSPCVVAGRAFGQGGCYTANSRAREGACVHEFRHYIAKHAPVHFPRREGDRQTDTDRQTDRRTDGQTDRDRDRETEIERLRDRDRQRETDRETGRQTHSRTETQRHRDGGGGWGGGEERERHTHTQTERQRSSCYAIMFPLC